MYGSIYTNKEGTKPSPLGPMPVMSDSEDVYSLREVDLTLQLFCLVSPKNAQKTHLLFLCCPSTQAGLEYLMVG